MKTYWLGSRLLVFAAVLLGSFGLLMPSFLSARNVARELSCANNLKHTSFGLLNYESAQRQLPLAIEMDDAGRPWRSWRTHVYPSYLEQLPRVYDTSTAWDSSTNIRLLDGTPIPTKGKNGVAGVLTLPRVPECFFCPACKKTAGVNYVVITGEGTFFPHPKTVKLSDALDGPENTLLLVESVTCTPEWTEPRDLDVNTMEFEINSHKGPSISSFHSGGALVCFADSEVFCVTPSITQQELKALISINGGESINREDLVSRGVLIHRR